MTKHDTDDTHSLLEQFTIEDIIDGASRSPRKSSPGIDGLPYEILSLLFKHPGISKLALMVYNNALTDGAFSSSWLSTSTALLPKKGDLTSLKNWRPISLINADAKIFTRLLNLRLMSVFSSRISPCQMGFMPQRFIGEHGRLLQLVMASASIQHSESIGLLLDQEKAYDRIHPGYLTQVLRRFGVPPSLHKGDYAKGILVVFKLIYSIRFNPLSPLLFNIAFDPFLRLISSDSTFHGYSFSNPHEEASRGDNSSGDNSPGDGSSGDGSFSASVPDTDTPPPVKILAYADDVLVLLHSPSDFFRLQWAVNIYTSASNALLNYSKTQAFSLSGASLPTWQQFLVSNNILSWYDCKSTEALIYLGSSLYFCLSTLPSFKAWGGKFLNSNSFPRIKFSTLTLPRSCGGIGALDPAVQIQALQWRWLAPMVLSAAMVPGYSSLFPQSLFPSVTYGQYLLQVTSVQHALHPPSSGLRALFFLQFRSQHFSSSSLHCFSSLFDALGSILSLFFANTQLNIATTLALPLSSLLHAVPVSASHPPLVSYTPPLPVVCTRYTFRRMIGLHLLIFDSSTNRLRLRTFTPVEIQHFSRTTKQLINLIHSTTIQFRPFVQSHLTNKTSTYGLIDFAPVCLSIFGVDSASQLPSKLLSTSPKIFRTILSTTQQTLNNTITTPGSISSVKSLPWSWFWRLSIPLRSRTIWYKIIHRVIPHTSLLHKFIPQNFPSPLCPLCSLEPDSITHFFYTCQKIQPVWQQISGLFIE
ncbi:hypothetical protein G6F56_006593 [Rhizopus delemar]|nr:hypothetical protein G6F56_006593 [Rhizopus delemar]